MNTLAALIAGRKGWGKTTLLCALAWRWTGPVIAWDPTGDLRAYGLPDWATVIAADDALRVARAVAKAAPGTLVLLDELPRLMVPFDSLRSNKLLGILDLARNFGVHVVAACKRPASLPPLIGDLTDVFVHGPYRTPASREWLSRAGLDPDLDIPPRHWAVAYPERAAVVVSAAETPAALLAAQPVTV